MTDIKEYLEEQMDLRRVCTVRFIGNNGGIATIRTRIIDLCLRDGRNFVKTEEGLEILQEKITELNGHSFNSTC